MGKKERLKKNFGVFFILSMVSLSIALSEKTDIIKIIAISMSTFLFILALLSIYKNHKKKVIK